MHDSDGLHRQLSSARLEEWIRLEEQKRTELLDADCDEALSISSLDGLHENLRELMDRFKLRDSFLPRLEPALYHLRSFTQAITSASQYTPAACLVWGGIQAVVESACAVSSMSEQVTDMLVELNMSLPQFEKYVALFPGQHELQWALQDLYADFVGFCVTAAQYFRRGSTRSFLANFFTSTPHSNLQKSKVNIQRHIKTFKQAAEFTHRENVRKQHIEVISRLDQRMPAMQPEQLPEHSEPADEVKFPVHRVGMNQNFTFVGRDDDLTRMHEVLIRQDKADAATPAQLEAEHFVKKKGGGPACCVLQGLGGVGKTQTALEYTYRYRTSYDAVFWLSAEHDWTLTSSYAAISDALSLLDPKLFENDGNKRQTLAIEKAREWLQSTERPWLLVFDNVEDVGDLDPFIPLEAVGRGSIIITTQKVINFSITKIFGTVPIKSFNRDDAALLLFKYLQKDPADEKEEEIARDLADTVDGLPLAIATIGGYINQTGSNLEEYAETLKTSSNAWTASAVGPVNQYEKNLETVFDIAISELSENARGLIGVLAFLNPDHIPEDLFIKAIETRSLPFLRSKADLLEMVRELRKRQLVRRDVSGTAPYIAIHRTVQWNVLLYLSKDYTHRWRVFQQAFRVVRDVLPDESPFIVPSPGKWPRYQRYGPHILSLRTHCLWPDPPIELPVNFAQVLSDMGTYMWHAGKFSEGVEALETAIDVMDENDVNKVNPLRANVYEILGIMSSFEGVGEREKSMGLRYKALEARRVSYDAIPNGELTRDDEIKRWLVESDIAYGLVQQEDFADADEIMQRVLKKYHEWGSEDDYPYQYSQYYQIHAVCMMAAGKPVEAIESITRCVELLIKSSNLMHPMTQLMRFITGFLTWHAGEPKKALEICESVLEARRKIIGEFSHFTLESYSTCGRLLAEQGEFEKARVYLDRCLERRRRAAWTQEGVARAQFRYAHVLNELGETEEAQKQGAMAKKTRERFMKECPMYLPDTGDDEAVFDQMVSIWSGRFTGKMKQTVAPIDTNDAAKDGSGT